MKMPIKLQKKRDELTEGLQNDSYSAGIGFGFSRCFKELIAALEALGNIEARLRLVRDNYDSEKDPITNVTRILESIGEAREVLANLDKGE